MQLYKISKNLTVNLDMICSICQLPGNKCGSSYEDQDETFLLITMASGKKYRAEVGAIGDNLKRSPKCQVGCGDKSKVSRC
ncbi:hypothetical protein HW132_02185 [Brasilonema sp. CT11]|nr:hypothetical protein [Brasilonema sp. CT11]